jgi:recombination protein RecT
MSMSPEEYKNKKSEQALMSPEQAQAEQAEHESQIVHSKTAMDKIKAYAAMDEVQKRFVTLLGDKVGRAYVESVVIAVANNGDLQKCSASSIMISAMRAASLHLSVDPLLHQAHLVPMGKDAMLILDYRGLQQLSINTGYYEIAPFVGEVYEGETVKLKNRFSGEVEVVGERTSDIVIGWLAYFKGKQGDERWLYMSNEDCDAHGKKYSKSFSSPRSAWTTDREKMRRKTVLRQLLTRYGNFSPEIKSAIMQEDVVEGETFTLPSDDSVVIPEKEKRAESDMLSQMGFGG